MKLDELSHMEVAGNELGKWLGITSKRVSEIKRLGHITRGEGGGFPLRDSIIRAFKNKLQAGAPKKPQTNAQERKDEADARYKTAKAQIEEIKVMQACLRVVPVVVVNKVVTRYYTGLRSMLDSLPTGCSKQANPTDPVGAELAIEKA